MILFIALLLIIQFEMGLGWFVVALIVWIAHLLIHAK